MKNLFLTCLLTLLSGISSFAYQESPTLSELVSEGQLPPVEQRLPENPLIVTPVDEVGQYGGTWRRVLVGPFDMMLNSRMGYEPLVRWDRSGQKVLPGLAESWEISDGGRTYTFHLRKGMKWSDGVPFTAEAFTFQYEDVFLNEEISPVFPTWLSIDGKRVEITAVDDFTVQFKFPKPYGVFLELGAFRGIQGFLYTPAHYLKQYHIKYAEDQSQIQEEMEKEGYDTWYQLFANRANANMNPELPVMMPFQLKSKPPATRVVAQRNPYYWKVDTEGNQLPYIDEVAFVLVQNAETANFKTLTGDIDFQSRYIDSANYSLFMQNRKKGDYRVLADPAPGSIAIYLNQCSRDPEMKKLLQDRRFRTALSMAINREEIIDLIYSGMAVPSRGVASKFDPYYLPEYSEKYLEYDPEKANLLLDEIGLKRTASGMRKLPNGETFRQILNIFPSETGTSIELWELVAEYWREVGLDFVTKSDARTLSLLQVTNGNSDFWAYLIAGMHWVIDPVWYVPWKKSSYFAPLYGQYVSSDSKAGEKPPQEYQNLLDWYLQLRSETDEERKLELGRNILGQWSEECYVVGICRRQVLTIVSNRFKNVPDEIIHSYRLLTPGYIGVEQFFIED